MADLNETNRITDKALTKLNKRLVGVEKRFTKDLLAWVNKFATKEGGGFSQSQANLDRVKKFKKNAEKFLLKAGYYAALDDFYLAFGDIARANKQVHKDLNGINVKSNIITTAKSFAIQETTRNMEGAGLNQAFINPIKDALRKRVSFGASLSDTIKALKGNLLTSTERQGALKRYAIQISRDALGQFEGELNEAIRVEYDLDGILYVGSLVKDSRWQCERWVNFTKNGKRGLLRFDELTGEIRIAENQGSGMIPNTTPESFQQNRGGYNCRHTAYPVRLANYQKK